MYDAPSEPFANDDTIREHEWRASYSMVAVAFFFNREHSTRCLVLEDFGGNVPNRIGHMSLVFFVAVSLRSGGPSFNQDAADEMYRIRGLPRTAN